MSVARTAAAFGVTRQTTLNWRSLSRREDPRLLPRIGGLSDLVRELVHRMRREWPRWGTRRIAGQLARLGVRASRSSVQRILRRPRAPKPDERLLPETSAGLLAKRPSHIWMIDQRSRRVTSPAARFRSGSITEIDAFPFCVFLRRRSPRLITSAPEPEGCSHVGAGPSAARHQPTSASGTARQDC